MQLVDRVLRRIGEWIGVEAELDIPVDALLVQPRPFPPRSVTHPATLDRAPQDCTHPWGIAVDDLPVDDARKVWRCDGCGIRYRHVLDPMRPWVSLEIIPVEVAS